VQNWVIWGRVPRTCSEQVLLRGYGDLGRGVPGTAAN